MEATEREILDQTHYGLKIYAHVLNCYYTEQTVLSISGRHCLPAQNPFRGNRHTLMIVQNGYTFEHTDSEDLSFKGNALTFAALHYNLEGQLLYEKLQSELPIKLKTKVVKKVLETTQPEPIIPKLYIPECSFFKRPVRNINPLEKINLAQIADYIKWDRATHHTNTLRAIQEPKQAREYKADNFDYVTFSGLFTKRSDKDLVRHSGLLCVDFDHLKEKESLKEKLLKDEYFNTELLFTSPSGDGLKWVVEIDITKHTHTQYFAGIESYVQKVYELKIDPSGKDVSRACFLPHDSQVYINPKYTQQ